jgi:hypothetical protein
LVGICYRNPSSKEINNDNLLHLITKASDLCEDTNFLLMGDFNFPEINFEMDSVSSGPDSAPFRFFRMIQDQFLFQFIRKPTRMREGYEPSILDYVIANEEDTVGDITYEPPLGKSDHVVLSWTSTIEAAVRDSTQEKLNYWKGNFDAINSALQKINWKNEMVGRSVEDMWLFLKNTVLHLVQKHVPVKQKPKKKKNAWITRATIQEMAARGRAWTDYRDNTCKSKYRQYTEIRNRVNKMVRADKQAYTQKVLNSFKGNPKRFYGHMRNLKTVKAQVTQLRKKDGTMTTDNQQAAEALCEYSRSLHEGSELN